MQRIERYGVIALVFLLVTIVAVSLWGERDKSDSWFSFLDRDSKTARIEGILADASSEAHRGGQPATSRELVNESLPLSPQGWESIGSSATRGPGAPPAYFGGPSVLEGDSSIAPEDIGTVGYESAKVDSAHVEEVPEPKPRPVVAREYTIRSGDTLSEIAMRELGTKERWRELVELNPGLDPARLQVGAKIRLNGAAKSAKPTGEVVPAIAKTSSDAAPAAAGRSYTIRSGDTLSEIAMRELGTTQRWRELVELNPGLDPARLHVGVKIRLPGGATESRPAVPQRETRVARAETPAPAAKGRSKVR